LPGDRDLGVLSSAAHNGPARNTFCEDAFQLFGEFKLLRGVPLHAQEETGASIADNHLTFLQEVRRVLRERELRDA
jgi:hypothetical protein